MHCAAPTASPITTSSAAPSTSSPSAAPSTYDFTLEGPMEPSDGNLVGTVTVGQEMTMQFYFTVNEECGSSWCNVIQVGDSWNIRLPGIFVKGVPNQFEVTMTDNEDWTNAQMINSEDFEVVPDGEEHFFYFRYTANERVYAIDDVEVYREECNATTSCSFNNSDYHGIHSVYMNPPWTTPPMNMTIRDLRISDGVITTAPTEQPTVEPTSDPTTRYNIRSSFQQNA